MAGTRHGVRTRSEPGAATCRVTVIQSARNGDRRVAVADSGQFEVTVGGEPVTEAWLPPATRARITSLVQVLDRFRDAAFDSGPDAEYEVRWQLSGKPVRRVAFSRGGRCPDAGWELLGVAGGLAGSQIFDLPRAERAL